MVRRVASAFGLVLVLGAVVACQPPPPVPVFHVNSAADTPDAVVGDGVCSTSGAVCTLRAAVQEAAALGRADVVIDASPIGLASPLVIEGEVHIGPGTVAAPEVDGHIEVPAGSRLDLVGVQPTYLAGELGIEVSGTLIAARVRLRAGVTLLVRGGAVFVADSVVLGTAGPAIEVPSAATVFVQSSTVSGPDAIDFRGSAAVTVESSLVLGGCTPGLVSAGYNLVGDGCELDDLQIGDDGASIVMLQLQGGNTDLFDYEPSAVSVLTDAVPIGAGGCDPGRVDLNGDPRGVDGDTGVGDPRCDVGAVERQP